jgi:hypothetical protein
MNEYIPSIFFLFSTQVLVFSILLFIFYFYYQTFARQYVKYWLISFAALILSYLIKAFAIFLNTKFVIGFWFITAELSVHFCHYIFVLFLVIGVLHAKNKVVDRQCK